MYDPRNQPASDLRGAASPTRDVAAPCSGDMPGVVVDEAVLSGARAVASAETLLANVPGVLAAAGVASLNATKIDRLICSAISDTIGPDGTCDLAEYHGIDVHVLAEEVLDYSPALASSRWGNQNLQRLAAGLLRYRDLFAPTPAWTLLASSSSRAWLLWSLGPASEDVLATGGLPSPLVLDVISRSTHLALIGDGVDRDAATGALDRTTPLDTDPGTRVLVRILDLSRPEQSMVRVPGRAGLRAWRRDLDPICTQPEARLAGPGRSAPLHSRYSLSARPETGALAAEHRTPGGAAALTQVRSAGSTTLERGI